MTIALRTLGLTKRWGSFAANDGIDLLIEKGARHAFIGPNGAGKTTLINVLTGATPPSAGTVFLGERDVTHLSEHRRVKAGLARTYQINTLFPRLTVLETVLLAILERDGNTRRWLRPVAAYEQQRTEAIALLATLRLDRSRDRVVGTLPYGRQRLLEIAIGLALKASVLLLDEPAAGVGSGESHEVYEVIAGLPPDVTILFVEHDMGIVFRFATRATVLVNGRVLVEGAPDEIASDPRVKQVYLGEAELA